MIWKTQKKILRKNFRFDKGNKNACSTIVYTKTQIKIWILKTEGGKKEWKE